MALKLTNSGTGVAISCTGTSARAAVVGTGNALVVTNNDTVPIFVQMGGSTVTATSASYPILPGTKEILRLDIDIDVPLYVAGITAGTAATLLVHRVQL